MIKNNQKRVDKKNTDITYLRENEICCRRRGPLDGANNSCTHTNRDTGHGTHYEPHNKCQLIMTSVTKTKSKGKL